MGRHALIPYPRRDDEGAVLECCQSFVLDNGAFTTWKQGKPLDVPGFTAWAESLHRHPAMDWALIPDSIEGDEADNDALLRDWPAHLRAVGVPVWHLHESIGRLQRLCREWRTVALGSSGAWATPGTAGWWSRMSEAMNAFCDVQDLREPPTFPGQEPMGLGAVQVRVALTIDGKSDFQLLLQNDNCETLELADREASQETLNGDVWRALGGCIDERGEVGRDGWSDFVAALEPVIAAAQAEFDDYIKQLA